MGQAVEVARAGESYAGASGQLGWRPDTDPFDLLRASLLPVRDIDEQAGFSPRQLMKIGQLLGEIVALK